MFWHTVGRLARPASGRYLIWEVPVPSLPGSHNYVTLSGTFLNVDGSYPQGSMTFNLNNNLIDVTSDFFLRNNTQSVNLLDGEFSISLLATDDAYLTPDGWGYIVTENVNGAVRTYTIELPYSAGASQNLINIAQSPSPGPALSYYLIAASSSVVEGQVATASAAGSTVVDWSYQNAGWFNVMNYGAAGNGTTNDTTAIQDAINAAGTNGGVVYLPAATYNVTNLTVPSHVMICGDGPGASVLSVSSSTASGTSVISLASASTTRFVTLRDFQINGNGVAGVTGINITNTSLSPSTPGFHRLWNLVVQNMGSDGYYYEAQIESYTLGCLAFQCLGYGFNMQNGATDSRWVSCTAGAIGKDGFYTSGSNCHYVACKAYYAGYNYSTGAWGTGNGWHVDAISTYFSAGITYTGCEAQDCSNNGWFFDSSGGPINSISMVGCTIDSCNASGGAAGAASSGIQTNGLADSSIVGNTVFNRSGGAGVMPYYLSVAGTQTGLVISGNNVYGITDTGIYYVSGYGYMLLESFESDLSGVPTVKLPSFISNPGSSTSLSNGTTIAFNQAYMAYPVTASAAVTGIIMGAGTSLGQIIQIDNGSAYPVTFAAAGTSHVLGGTSVVIQADSFLMLFWNGTYWVPQGTSINATASNITALGTAAAAGSTGLSADAGHVHPEQAGWFNVTAYGAAANGTTNDTTAVQNALNAIATAKGGTLYLPGQCLVTISDLTYTSAYPLTIVGEGAQLDGSGGAGFISTGGTAGGTVLAISNCGQFVMRDVGFYANDGFTGTDTATYTAISLTSATATLERVKIDVVNSKAPYNCGVLATSGAKTVISDCNFTVTTYGAWFSGGQLMTISDTIISTTAGSGYGAIYMYSNAQTLRIRNSQTQGGDRGLYVVANGSDVPAFIFIDDFEVNNPMVAGVQLNAGSQVWANQLWISGAGLTSSDTAIGLYVFGTGFTGTAEFTNCIFQDMPEFGCLIDGGEGYIFTGCSFGGNGYHASDSYDDLNIASGSVEWVTLNGCHFDVDPYLQLSSTPARSAVYIGSGTTNYTINDCQFAASGYGTTAVYDNTAMSNNAYSGNINAPNTFSGAISQISGNHTLGAQDSTILVNASANLTITIPAVSNMQGRIFKLIRMDSTSSVVTIATSSTQLINGATSITLSGQWTGKTLQTDGSNWYAF